MSGEKSFKDNILDYYKTQDHEFYKGLDTILEKSFERHQAHANAFLDEKDNYQNIKISKKTLNELVAGFFSELEATTIHLQRSTRLIQREYSKELDISNRQELVDFVSKIAKEKFGWYGVPPDALYNTIIDALGTNEEVDALLKALKNQNKEVLISALDHLISTASSLKRGEMIQGINSRYRKIADDRKIRPEEWGAALAAQTYKVSEGKSLEDAVDLAANPQKQYSAALGASQDYIQKQLETPSWKTAYNL
jgi:hypothetical protein